MNHYPPQHARLPQSDDFVSNLCPLALCPRPQKSQLSCVVCQRVRTLMSYCAFSCLQVRISARSDASSDLSVLGVLDFCLLVQGQEKVVLCCGWGCGWGCDADHNDVLVPFDNQRVCHSFYHHYHRKVIFLICPQVFGPCLLSESSMETMSVVFGHSAWPSEVV